MNSLILPAAFSSEKTFVTAHCDARSALLSALIFTGGVLFIQVKPFWPVAACGLYLFLFSRIAGVSPVALLKKLLRIIPMLLMISLPLPFTTSDISPKALLSFFGLEIYQDGLFRFMEINIKSLLIVSAMIILSLGYPLTRILPALEFFRVPKWAIAILTYMHRLIFLLGAELQRMHTAFRARAPRMPRRRKLKSIGQMSGVYFTRIIERSERTFLAMISRGFSGHFPSLHEFRWHWPDSLLVLFTFIFSLLVALWK